MNIKSNVLFENFLSKREKQTFWIELSWQRVETENTFFQACALKYHKSQDLASAVQSSPLSWPLSMVDGFAGAAHLTRYWEPTNGWTSTSWQPTHNMPVFTLATPSPFPDH